MNNWIRFIQGKWRKPLIGVTSDVRNVIFYCTDRAWLLINKSFLCFIKQMTSVLVKENLKCFNIMNQIWTITYCLWELDTVRIEYEKYKHDNGSYFHDWRYLYLKEVYMWINIAKFLSNTHLSNIISNALLQSYVRQDSCSFLISFFLPPLILSISFLNI